MLDIYFYYDELKKFSTAATIYDRLVQQHDFSYKIHENLKEGVVSVVDHNSKSRK